MVGVLADTLTPNLPTINITVALQRVQLYLMQFIWGSLSQLGRLELTDTQSP